MAESWFELRGDKIYIWYTHLHKFMWIYNFLDQFEKLKTIHLNTKWYLMWLYQKKKNLQKKKLIHNIVFIYWDISNVSDLFFFRAKTQVMNETINGYIDTECNICEFLLFWLMCFHKYSNYNMIGTN